MRSAAETEFDGLDLILPMIFGGVQGQLLAFAAQIDLAERLESGPLTTDRLAADTSNHPQALERALRALAALGVLERDVEGGWRCTPAGRLLRRDSPLSMHHYARMNNADWLLRTGSRLPDSVRSGRESFAQVHDTSCYAYLGAHPDDAAAFNAALSELSRQDAMALAQAVDFSGVKRVVDVGGGEGQLLRELLDTHSGLRAVLLDLPEVVAGAGVPLGVHVEAGRCEISGADFRDGVPTGADLYVLKRVVSTCPEDHIRTVLSYIRDALPAAGRLIVADPDPASRYGALLDVLMLEVTGGALRTADEMRALLAETGFRLDRSVTTPSKLQVIEAVPA